MDTRLAKESADYAKGQEQAAKDAAKQQVQGLREKATRSFTMKPETQRP